MMKKDKDTNDQKSESHMKHNDESKVPEDMTSTNEGEFKVGDKVTITAGHMARYERCRSYCKRCV